MERNSRRRWKEPILFCHNSKGSCCVSNGRVTKDNRGWVRTTYDSNSWVQVEIENLLSEYKEIIAEDVPNGLPPIICIIHYMDMILGPSFLNKETYRLTPTENEELNIQL